MNDIKSALNALVNRTQEVDFPNLKGAFVRPVPVGENMAILAESKGAEDEDSSYSDGFMAYSLVDKDGEQLFTKEEFTKWVNKAEWDIVDPLKKAINSLNDFQSKSAEAKKK
tara:strand:+ start:1393 stop:1728 length:336 start_codon:yes stop_codon:yes gene_type:complete